jgi:uncharacterized membrane protein
MKNALIKGWQSFVKLFRFLFWYAVSVAAIFYLLPVIALFAESQYEALSNAAKFISILGFFSVIGAWQIISMRDRRRRSVEGM